MAKLKINDIKPTGAELFDDSESFMNDLSNDELEQAMGGLILSPLPTIYSIQKSCNCPPTCTPTIFTTKTISPVIL